MGTFTNDGYELDLETAHSVRMTLSKFIEVIPMQGRPGCYSANFELPGWGKLRLCSGYSEEETHKILNKFYNEMSSK